MVSVIVPVYNVENVLHYCIDSILNQSYTDFELLLIDDGSTDRSGDICEKYAVKDTRIRVIHKENGGVSSARNFGIDNANGEYICFVDSDDYIDSTFLEKLLKTKNSYPQIDNYWCCFQTVNQYGGERIQDNTLKGCQLLVEFDTSQIMTLHENWLDAGPVCKLFSNHIIKENGIRFDTSLSLGEDLLFNFCYLDNTNKRIIVCNETLYNYVRVNDESLSQKYREDLFDIYRYLYKNIELYLKKWNCDDSQMRKYYNSIFYAYEDSLRNTYHKNSTVEHKLSQNRKIMQSDEFVNALRKSDCFIHPLYRFAYQHHSYMMVRALDIILKIKKAK